MKAAALLHQLRSQEIQVAVVGGDLKISGRKEALTADLVATLRAHKAELVAHLEVGDVASDAIPKATRKDRYDLSSAQKQIWLTHQMNGSGRTYHMPFACRINGPLNESAFRQAWQNLAHRHESLRTVFGEHDGIPFQIVNPEPVLSYSQEDIRSLDDPEAHINAALPDFINEEFDLTNGPLWRTRVWQVADRVHVVALVMHHIVSDGWSMGVLIRDVFGRYEALLANEPSAVEPLAIQYTDFAEWEQQFRQTNEWETARAYWLNQMNGDVTAADPGPDFSRPAIRNAEGVKLQKVLTGADIDRLRTFARQHDVSLYVLLLTTLNVLLHRYASANDIIIGCPAAGRNHWQLEDQIGLYVNTLPIRNLVTSQDSFADLLQRVKRTVLEGYEQQAYGLDELIDELKLPRSANRGTLFDVLFTMQNEDLVEQLNASLPDQLRLSVQEYPLTYQPAKFDWLFEVQEAVNSLAIDFTYDRNLFTAGRMSRMLGHFEHLLNEACRQPDQAIGQLALLTPVEEAELRGFNQTDYPLPQDATLCSLFAEQVARTPQAIALRQGELHWTYAQLDGWANQIAQYLLDVVAVPTGSRVGLLVDRSGWQIAGLLGTLKAGCAYVPLDLNFPVERLAYQIENAEIGVMLVDQAGTLAKVGLHHLHEVTPQTVAQAGVSEVPVTVPVAPDQTAYVIYTSGSTGRPKGVAVAHRGVVNRMLWMAHFYAFDAREVVLQKTPYVFDVSVWEIFMPLLNGGVLVLCRQSDIYNPTELLRLIEQYQVTTVHFVPGMYQVFLESLTDSVLSKLATVHQVFTSGEALTALSVQTHHQRLTGVALHNLYGPTEASIEVSYYQTQGNEDEVPIGKPIDNIQLWVVDGQYQLLPKQVWGEIYIGGVGVAQGYINQPELTAERFVDVPALGGRLYRTGDRGRWNETGELEYGGRLDGQVKLRGYRIELGEIETAVHSLEAVDQAVILVQQVSGEPTLVCYYRSQGEPTHMAWPLELGKKLPTYMIPTVFHRVEHWPMTPTGKIDRKALIALPITPDTPTGAITEPQTELETKVLSVWQTVLIRPAISVTDNFFQLGGNSLSASRLAARLTRALATPVELKHIFQFPTIRQLADHVAGQLLHKQPLAIEPIQEQSDYPLSNAQHRLWILHQLDPASTVYAMPFACTLTGLLNREKLQQALDRLVARHESLRTVFRQIENEPRQVILPPTTEWSRVLYVDLRKQDDRISTAQTMAQQEASTPFDLGEGPLCRVKLLQLDNEQYVLLITLHHIIADAWSMQVLFQELIAQYNKPTESIESLPVQYKDIAAWQEAQRPEASLTYWQQKLAGLPVLDLPTTFPRPAVKTHAGNRIEIPFDATFTNALRAAAAERQTSLFTILTTLAKALLHRYAGQTDITVGTTIAGRDQAGLENQIGFYINLLALRTQFAADDSFDILSKAVQQTLLEAYEHQHVPFEQLAGYIANAGNRSRSPIFDVTVEFVEAENAFVDRLSLDGLSIEPFDLTYPTAKYDLSFRFVSSSDDLAFVLEYNTGLFSAAFAQQLSQHFINTGEAFLADATQPIATYPLLSADERQELVIGLNQTGQFDLPTVPYHVAFEQIAEQYADEVAVVWNGESYTFRRLNELANQLAHYLQWNQSVTVGSRVGILMSPSAYMVISVLAVLKAGGTFVPIDVTSTQERKKYVLQDSSTKVLLTDATQVATLNGYNCTLVPVDTQLPELTTSPTNLSVIDGTKQAYLLYTSGAIGQPRGIQITHQNLLNYVTWANDYYFSNQRGYSFACFTSLAISSSLTSIFTTLLRADTLVVHDGNDLNATLLALFDSSTPVNTIKLTPSQVNALSRLPITHTNVQKVILSGEKPTHQQVQTLLRLNPTLDIYNEYGPAETTIGCTATRVTPDTDPSVVGKPIDNNRAYVLDKYLNPLPFGVWGELFIGGQGVGAGYLNQPQFTRQKFVADPFREDAQRMFRTGDIGRWTETGTIQYLGRIDNQVKVDGHRVRLDEIEMTLVIHEYVTEACVLMNTGAQSAKQVIAYVATSQSVEEADLKRFLQARLPASMIPDQFVIMDSLPLNADGRVNRQALPQLAGRHNLKQSTAHVPPTTVIEHDLVQIWKRILKRDQLGITDSFFDLGGNSLLLIALHAELKKLFPEKPLLVADLFKFITIQRLSHHLTPTAEPTTVSAFDV